jgi:pyruvate/2-oxoglutarate dehydrogenase complex dihydrolipoamide dehydrogenase (E3) component
MGLDLAENGHNVTVIEKGKIISARGHKIYRISLLEKIKNYKNLNFMLESECVKINDHSVTIKTIDKKLEEVTADNVIIAIGMIANVEDTMQFYNIVQDTYYVGDCDKPGKVLNAINDAYFIAANL